MSWCDRTLPIQIGETVAYSKQFLRSIACYTGDMPRAKGKVTALIPVGKEVTLAEIEWDLPDLPHRVNVKNLCRVNSIAYGT
jgi:hypothetical protein